MLHAPAQNIALGGSKLTVTEETAKLSAREIVVDHALLDACRSADGATLDMGSTGALSVLDAAHAEMLGELLVEDSCTSLRLVGVALVDAKAGEAVGRWLQQTKIGEVAIGNGLVLPLGPDCQCAALNACGQDLRDGEASLIGWWLQRPAVVRTIVEVDVSQNPRLGTVGAAALARGLRVAERVEAVVVGPKATRLSLSKKTEAAVLDLSGEDLKAADVVLVASAVGSSEVESITLCSTGKPADPK